ncbi:hypothetical protein HDV00_012156 [Rhizophlyctis rosea]|nr:hypothetical protein HDV00_012156 [Rhizophlyctis rosea]
MNDRTKALGDEIWSEIVAFLSYPQNLVRTNHHFRNLGKDPHTRSRFLRYRFGTRPSLLYATDSFPRLLQPVKVITFLLQKGAVLPRALVQRVVRTASTSPKLHPEVVAALLNAGVLKYGGNLELHKNDNRDFERALLRLSGRREVIYSDESARTITQLVRTYNYYPTLRDEDHRFGIRHLIVSPNPKIYALFLMLQSAVGYDCRECTRRLNDDTLLPLIESRPLPELQYLFKDRALEVTPTLIDTLLLKIEHDLRGKLGNWLRFLPLLRQHLNPTQIAAKVRQNLHRDISRNVFFLPDFFTTLQKEVPDVTQDDIDSAFRQALDKEYRVGPPDFLRNMDKTRWTWMLTHFSPTSGAIQHCFDAIFVIHDVGTRFLGTVWAVDQNWRWDGHTDGIFKECVKKGVRLGARHVHWITRRAGSFGCEGPVEMFVEHVLGRVDGMEEGEKREWREAFVECLRDLESHWGKFFAVQNDDCFVEVKLMSVSKDFRKSAVLAIERCLYAVSPLDGMDDTSRAHLPFPMTHTSFLDGAPSLFEDLNPFPYNHASWWRLPPLRSGLQADPEPFTLYDTASNDGNCMSIASLVRSEENGAGQGSSSGAGDPALWSSLVGWDGSA